ncbi:MAG: pilus assembly FimT family protein [Clostridium sp.]
MKRRKKGFTLIEMMGVIGILVVILTITSSGFLYFKKIQRDLKNDNLIYEIEQMLHYGKQYAMKNSKELNLSIDNGKKYISLVSNEGTQKKLTFDDNITLEKVSSGELRIDSTGSITAGSIIVKQSGEKIGSIKIRVGVDYINVEK